MFLGYINGLLRSIRRFLTLTALNSPYGQARSKPLANFPLVGVITGGCSIRFTDPQPGTSGGVRYGALLGQSFLGGYPVGYGLHSHNDTVSVQIRSAGTVKVAIASTSIRGTGWHRVEYTINLASKLLSIFVNGELEGQTSFSLPASDLSQALGDFVLWRGSAGTFNYVGDIDDIFLNYTDAQGETTSLLRYDIEQSAGQVLIDSSGNNNHADITNPIIFNQE